MGTRTVHNRRRRRAGAAGVLAALIAGTAVPAQAGILGDLTGTVTGTVTGVVDTTSALADSTARSLLGPTGWIEEGGVTGLGHVAEVIGADRLHQRGVTGAGVGVALIDTGVVPVAGLTSGNVVNGPDLSFESQSDQLRYLDTFGHGTHMAGIIAGSEPAAGGAGFTGVAPGARLTSLKVASTEGAVDVSQVIAAVDWVVAHRGDDPKNPIRVLNLSYGTDGVQDHRLDPLTHAVENAWRAGIVVVAAGGNSGTAEPRLNNPAYDPYVLAVGASDTRGTVSALDDVVPGFSSRGDAARRVDLVAPGRSIASLRVPGSYVDDAHPGARVGDRLFKGSGSSQAAAVTSGAVALLLQARPDLQPDQVKAVLRSSAALMPVADVAGRGAGELDVYRASMTPALLTTQSWPASTGLGSLEASRGTQHVADGGVELTGERHVLGAFDAATWAPRSAAFAAWSGGTWAGSRWTGDCLCETSWTGSTWSSTNWKGRSWSGRSWSGRSWSGRSWSGRSWSGRSWSSADWDGNSWTGRSWSGRSWSAAGWPVS